MNTKYLLCHLDDNKEGNVAKNLSYDGSLYDTYKEAEDAITEYDVSHDDDFKFLILECNLHKTFSSKVIIQEIKE